MYLHKIIKASFLILKKEKEILLYRRSNTGYYDNFFSIISGNVEKHETFEDAIIREAKEELGIELKKSDLSVAHILHLLKKDDESINVFFISENWEGAIKNLEPEKCGELIWSNTECLPKNMIPYVANAINDYFITNLKFYESK